MSADVLEVFVPCVEVGCGTGTAVVRDAKTGRRVRLTEVPSVVLLRGVAHLRAVSYEERGGLHLVRFPDRTLAWVRPTEAVGRGTAA